MTVQVADDDLIAAFAHALADRARVARLWEAQAKEWEAVASAQRAEVDALRRDLAGVRVELARMTEERMVIE